MRLNVNFYWMVGLLISRLDQEQICQYMSQRKYITTKRKQMLILNNGRSILKLLKDTMKEVS